jgi:hypothetical protein
LEVARGWGGGERPISFDNDGSADYNRSR